MNLGSPCKQLYDVPRLGKLPLWLCSPWSAACANAVDSCPRNTNLGIPVPWSGYSLECSSHLCQPLESSALQEIIWFSCHGRRKTVTQTFVSGKEWGRNLSMSHAENQYFFRRLEEGITRKIDVQGMLVWAWSIPARSLASHGNTCLPDPAEHAGELQCQHGHLCVGAVG